MSEKPDWNTPAFPHEKSVYVHTTGGLNATKGCHYKYDGMSKYELIALILSAACIISSGEEHGVINGINAADEFISRLNKEAETEEAK